MSLNWLLLWRTGSAGDWVVGGGTTWLRSPLPWGESNSRSIVSNILSLVLVGNVLLAGTALLVADEAVLGFKKKSKSSVTVGSAKLSLIDVEEELTLGGEFQRNPPTFPAYLQKKIEM